MANSVKSKLLHKTLRAISDNRIFHASGKLKTAKNERSLIHDDVKKKKVNKIVSSYSETAAKFFMQKQRQDNESDDAVFTRVVSLYKKDPPEASWPAQKKLSQFGLKTNSTTNLFATTNTMLAIINYLKSDAASVPGKYSVQETTFLDQAHKFILAAHSTAHCLNERRDYKYDILQRAALAACLGGSAIATVLTINAEAILAGGFIAILGGAVTGGIMLAAALVIIAAGALALTLIQHEKKQLREDLTMTISDGSEVGNVGSIMDKQRVMNRQLSSYLNVEAAENNLFVNLSTVLNEVQKAEDDLVPTVELKK